jgi:Rhodanese-like domain
VKNKLSIRNIYFLILVLALASLSFTEGSCQSAQIAPYSKYATDAEVPRISLEDAKKAFDAGTAFIIDARGDMQWDQEHIAGSMSSGKIGPIEQDYPNIPRGKKIIVYCS